MPVSINKLGNTEIILCSPFTLPMIYLEVSFTYPPESGLPIFSNGFKNQLTYSGGHKKCHFDKG